MSNLIRKIKNRLNLRRSVLDGNVIGSKTQIGKNVFMKGATIADGIQIGDNCKIFYASMHGNITIGNYTSLWGPNIDLNAAIHSIKIGNFCSIAKNVTIQEYNHDHSRFTTYFLEKNLLKSGKHTEEIVSKGPIIIEHDVWIGASCVILSGAHISTGAVVAAGSVVSGFVPPYAIVGGAPAKVIKYRFDEETRDRLLATEWWNWDEEKIKSNFPFLKNLISGH